MISPPVLTRRCGRNGETVMTMVKKRRRKRRRALANSSWTAAHNSRPLARTFVFADFSEAFGFMARAALRLKR